MISGNMPKKQSCHIDTDQNCFSSCNYVILCDCLFGYS
ncbi:hypothetical protein AAZX31_10G169000 [Glycine max]